METNEALYQSEALGKINALAVNALEEKRTKAYYREVLDMIVRETEIVIDPRDEEKGEPVHTIFSVTYAGECAKKLLDKRACCFNEDRDSLCDIIRAVGGEVVSTEGIFVYAKMPNEEAIDLAVCDASTTTCSCVAYFAVFSNTVLCYTRGEAFPPNLLDDRVLRHHTNQLNKMRGM